MVNQYNKTIHIYMKWMLDMIRKIELYTENIKDYNEFANQEMIIDAVITPLTQLGEISNQISKLQYEEFDKDLPLRQMNELRNFLVHTYHKIEYPYIWEIIKNHIPKLKTKLNEILK